MIFVFRNRYKMERESHGWVIWEKRIKQNGDEVWDKPKYPGDKLERALTSLFDRALRNDDGLQLNSLRDFIQIVKGYKEDIVKLAREIEGKMENEDE